MSQADPNSIEVLEFIALITEKYNEMTIANFCAVAATTLLYYDYLTTLSDEVRAIWQRKFSGATVLFALNRYITLVYRTIMIIQILPWQYWFTQNAANQTCSGMLRFTEGLTLIWELTVAAFMTLRMYAIWGKDRRIFAMVLLLGLVPPAINIYYYTTIKILATPKPFFGCGESVNLDTPTAVALSIFNRVFAISVDAFILILTWVKTAGIRRSFAGLKVKASLVSLLLRDGTVYFVCLLILNITNLIAIKYKAFGALPAITDVVTSILISRFILNLREVYVPGDELNGSSSFHASRISDMRFAKSIGNLGAPLDSSLSSYRSSRNSRSSRNRVKVGSFIDEDPGLLEDLQDLGDIHDGDYQEGPCMSNDPLLVGLASPSSTRRKSTVSVSSINSEDKDPEMFYVYYEGDDDGLSAIDIRPGHMV